LNLTGLPGVNTRLLSFGGRIVNFQAGDCSLTTSDCPHLLD
jgi:hypothetical protein